MTSEPQNSSSPEASVPQKALLRLVYIMGIILVVLFITLVAGITWKARHRPAPEATAEPTLTLNLAAADIRATELDGDRLMITTLKDIIIVDVRQNRVMLRLPLNAP